MGVPAFYRWVSEKFSKIISDMLEKRPNVIDGVVVPLNLTEPNPNGVEYDNLYIDMNGLIHPCSHPEDREAPSTEAEMYINITKYVDRLVAAVRPRRVLYLAIDGVAPRAKMNQQRSRRFRAAQDVKEKKQLKAEVIADMLAMGFDAPEEKEGADWDSNVITPGTEFMTKLTIYLRFYVLDRMNKDPYWKGLKVIYSDASEPGEGEHKIMSYIRNQRSQPNYDPNQRHVLHGLDADLIMLALATHEAHFTILREKVTFGRQSELPEVSEAQRMLDAQSMRNGVLISCLNPSDEWVYSKPLQALNISTLREYLDNEFSCLRSSLPFEYDLERIIDDFIFLCFFVGNDFLPHLPSLDIRDGALDFLIDCYKELLPSLGEYITNPGGYLNLRQADIILGKVGEIEDQIFIQRKVASDNEAKRREERFGSNRMQASSNNNMRQNRQQQHQQSYQQTIITQGNNNNQFSSTSHEHVVKVNSTNNVISSTETFAIDQNKLAAMKLKENLLGKRTITTAAIDADNCDTIGLAASKRMILSSIQQVNVSSSTTTTSNNTTMDDPIAIAVTKPKAMTPKEIEEAKLELKKRLKEKEQAIIDNNKLTVIDDVKLHEKGWKDRYYGEKYKKENVERGGGLARMSYSYVQGLCWVLRYYYQGVPSWNWYYPFHYAPFASDLVNIDSYGEIEFELSEPFHPIEQLLAVFPANSVKALPEACHWLMTDISSPIIDLYDDNIPIDPNGKHLPWLWILLLPFVDENRITEAFKLCKEHLTLHDALKNKFGKPVIFLHKDHPLCKVTMENIKYIPCPESDEDVLNVLNKSNDLHNNSNNNADDVAYNNNLSIDNNINSFIFDSITGNGMSAKLSPPTPSLYAPLHSYIPAPEDNTNTFHDICDNKVVCFTYELLSDYKHQSKLLDGVIHDHSILSQFDLVPKRPPRLNKGGFNISDLFTNQNNNQQGYSSQQGYNNQQGYRNQQGYSSQQGYGNNQQGYNNQRYDNNQQGYRSNQQGYNTQQGYSSQQGYNNTQQGYSSQQGYNNQRYNNNQQGYNNQRYDNNQQGYNNQQGFNSNQQRYSNNTNYQSEYNNKEHQYRSDQSRTTAQSTHIANYNNNYSNKTNEQVNDSHRVTQIKDQAFKQQVDRSSRMYTTHNNYNNNNTSNNNSNRSITSASGRSAIFLDTLPPPPPPSTKRKGHSFLPSTTITTTTTQSYPQLNNQQTRHSYHNNPTTIQSNNYSVNNNNNNNDAISMNSIRNQLLSTLQQRPPPTTSYPPHNPTR